MTAILTDLALDPDTHDILVEGGSMSMLDEGDALAQRIRIRLRHWRGEWYLDSRFGVLYRESLLAKTLTRAEVTGALRSFIESTPGVKELLRFTAEFDRATRTLTILDGLVKADSGALVELT